MEKGSPVVLMQFKLNEATGQRPQINSINFADKAEEYVKKFMADPAASQLTTTKLRGIYGLITNVYSRVNDAADFEKRRSDLQYIKVRMAYEAGRDKAVDRFLKVSHLMDAVSRVQTYEQFLVYCRFAESLVAYFKFYGGKE